MMANVFRERLVQRFRFFSQYADRNFDSGAAKPLESLAADQRVWILLGSNHAGDSGGDQRVSTWSGAALMGTRFQVDIESRAASFFSGLLEREDFSMFHAIVGVAAGADDCAVRVHNDGADAWIG